MMGSTKTLSVSELKATLSEQFRYVRGGGEVVVTDRGQPVARLVQLTEDRALDERLGRLEQAGLLRRGTGHVAIDALGQRPSDPGPQVRRAVLEERETGW